MYDYKPIKITKKYMEFEDQTGAKQRVLWEPSVSEFRDQIKNISFKKFYASVGGKACRNDKLENYRLPAIVHTYYQLFAETNIVPTAEDVAKAYIEEYVTVFKDGKRAVLKKEYKPGGQDLVFTVDELKARVCRAYNSYHRELDFLLQLIEAHGDEFNFYYCFNDDYFKGVDIVAYDKKNHRFDISTYYASQRSKAYKSLKDTCRHIYKNKQIHVMAYFDGPDKNVVECGDAMLYDSTAVDYVYSQLTE